MSYETSPGPEGDRQAALKRNIELLFSPTYCDVGEYMLPRESFPFYGQTTSRLYTPKVASDEAAAIALEGYVVHYGVPRLSLKRFQDVQLRWGRAKVLRDSVHCTMTDYQFSGGSDANRVYSYNADLLAPTVPYDERFDRIVRSCLSA